VFDRDDAEQIIEKVAGADALKAENARLTDIIQQVFELTRDFS